ncbi:hypothetical protein Ancab_014584 [Ancistrocladus abbreviatus]
METEAFKDMLILMATRQGDSGILYGQLFAVVNIWSLYDVEYHVVINFPNTPHFMKLSMVPLLQVFLGDGKSISLRTIEHTVGLFSQIRLQKTHAMAVSKLDRFCL